MIMRQDLLQLSRSPLPNTEAAAALNLEIISSTEPKSFSMLCLRAEEGPPELAGEHISGQKNEWFQWPGVGPDQDSEEESEKSLRRILRMLMKRSRRLARGKIKILIQVPFMIAR